MIKRREFVREMVAAGAASALGFSSDLLAAEPPPETKRIRLSRYPFDVACLSPTWIAEELLRAEGFESVEYVMWKPEYQELGHVASGAVDVEMYDFGVLLGVDAGMPLVALAGIHGGCYGLFAAPGFRSLRDLKGKTIAVATIGRQALVSMMAVNVGLDPRKDLQFIDSHEGVRLLAEGKVDAVLGFPPDPQLMKLRKIGVQLIDTAVDKPWSQYFCCMAIGNRDFVVKNPIATKRALRALLKAADLCATEPERSARTLVDRGFLKDYDTSVQALRDVPYRRWREYDSADSLRFYALRLHEAGLVKSNPKKLLAQGTDWRFIEQIKREMKG